MDGNPVFPKLSGVIPGKHEGLSWLKGHEAEAMVYEVNKLDSSIEGKSMD
jgi:hypothetical protein